jgi:hypothetical protein
VRTHLVLLVEVLSSCLHRFVTLLDGLLEAIVRLLRLDDTLGLPCHRRAEALHYRSLHLLPLQLCLLRLRNLFASLRKQRRQLPDAASLEVIEALLSYVPGYRACTPLLQQHARTLAVVSAPSRLSQRTYTQLAQQRSLGRNGSHIDGVRITLR